VIDHLDDIASDLSVFHGIRDAGEMESSVFFMLARRLGAYQGAVAARSQDQGGGTGSTRTPSAQGQQRYEQASHPAITPRNAEDAPPATAASLLARNSELGARWFSVRTVTAAEVEAAGDGPDTRQFELAGHPELRGGNA
jgi:hypothetical protein